MHDYPGLAAYGPRGRTLEAALSLQILERTDTGTVQVALLVDDGETSSYLCFVASDGRRRTAKLVQVDPDRRITGCELEFGADEVEIPLLFYAQSTEPQWDISCMLNLNDACFYPIPKEQLQHLFSDPSAQRKGLVEMDGAHIRYTDKNYEDPYLVAQRLAQKPTIIAKLLALGYECLGLGVRCYVGAFVPYNYLKMRAFRHCLVGAILLGLVSTRTLGGSVSILYSSTIARVFALFVPLLGLIYLALNPDAYHEIIDDPVYFLGLRRYKFGEEEIVEATVYAIAGLAVLWVIMSLFTGDDDEDEKKPKADYEF